MGKFEDFREWYLNDGVIEDLDQFAKSEVIDGIYSLRDIKNSLARNQKYELATLARQTERDLETYLGIERLSPDYRTSGVYIVQDCNFKYDDVEFSSVEEIFNHIRKVENRQNSLDKLDDGVDGSVS